VFVHAPSLQKNRHKKSGSEKRARIGKNVEGDNQSEKIKRENRSENRSEKKIGAPEAKLPTRRYDVNFGINPD